MFCPTEEDEERVRTLPAEAQADLAQQMARWRDENHVTSFPRLGQPATATTVRFTRDGPPLITDGPFMETKESIGGFGMIEADDLDQALRIAKGFPPRFTVEVRPLVETPPR
jgi:hypothetical protein